jgi:hypothetical protein
MTLQHRKLSELSALRHEYSTGPVPHGHTVLAVHFFGTIENSHTTDDYAFASSAIVAGLEAWQPWAILIDFRQVSYSWGDRMEDVLLAPQRWAEPVLRSRAIFLGDSAPTRFSTAVATSELNETALTSLVQLQMNLAPSELLFSTVESAIAALGEQLAALPLI